MLAVEHFFKCSSEWHENKNAFAFLGKSDVAVHFLAASNLVPVALTISLASPVTGSSGMGEKMELRVVATCCQAPIVTITDQELQLLRMDNVLRGWRCAPRCLRLRHHHVNKEGKKGATNGSSSFDALASPFLSEQTEALDDLLRRAHAPSCSSGVSLFHNELFLPGQSLSLFESPVIRTYCSALSVVQSNACESGSIGKDKGSSLKNTRWTLPRGWSAKSMSEAALTLHQTLFSSSWNDTGSKGAPFDTGKCRRSWTVEKCTLSARSVFVFSKPLIDVMNEEKLFHPLLHCTKLGNAIDADTLSEKEEEDYRVTYLLTYLMALHGFELVASQPFLDHEAWQTSAWFAGHHFRCRFCGAHPKVENAEEVHEGREKSRLTSFSVPQLDPLCSPNICSASSKESESVGETPSHAQATSPVGSSGCKNRGINENEEALLEDTAALAPGDNKVTLSPSLPLGSSLLELESTHPPSPHLAFTFCWKKEYNSHCACCPWNSLFLSNILAPTLSSSTSTTMLEEVTLSMKKTKPQESAAAEKVSMQSKASSTGMQNEGENQIVFHNLEGQHTLTFRLDSKELGYLLSACRLREQLLNAAEKDLSVPLESTHPLLEIVKNSMEVCNDIPIVVNRSAALCDGEDSETRDSSSGKDIRSDGYLCTDRLPISPPQLSREEVDRFLTHLHPVTKDDSGPAKDVGVPGTENTIKNGDDGSAHHGSCCISSAPPSVVQTIEGVSEVRNNVESLTELIWETIHPMVLSSASSMRQEWSREELLYSTESTMLDLPLISFDDGEEEKSSAWDEGREKQCREALEEFETQWEALEKLVAEEEDKEKMEKGNEEEKQRCSTDCILRHAYEAITSIGPLFLQTDAVAEALRVNALDALKGTKNGMPVKGTDMVPHIEFNEGERNSHASRIQSTECESKREEGNCVLNLQNISRKRGRAINEDVSSNHNLYLSQLNEKIQQYRVMVAEKLLESTKQQEEAMQEQHLFSLKSVQKNGIGDNSPNTKQDEWTSSAGESFVQGQHDARLYARGGLVSSSPALKPSFLSTSPFPPSLPRSHPPPPPQPSPFSHRRDIHSYPPNTVNSLQTSGAGGFQPGKLPMVVPLPSPFFTGSSLSASDSGASGSPFQIPATPSYPSSSLVSLPQRLSPAPVLSHSSVMPPKGGSSRLSSSTSGALTSNSFGSVLGRQPGSSILGAGHVSTGGPVPGRNRGGGRGRGEGGRGSGGAFRNDGTSGLGSGKMKTVPPSGSGSNNTGFKGNVRRGGGVGGDGSSGVSRMDASYGYSSNSGGGRGGRGQRSNRGGGGG